MLQWNLKRLWPCRVTGGPICKETPLWRSRTRVTTSALCPMNNPGLISHSTYHQRPQSLLFLHTDSPVLCFQFWCKTSGPSSLKMSFPFLYAPTIPPCPPPSVPFLPELFIRETWETGLKPCLRNDASCHSNTHMDVLGHIRKVKSTKRLNNAALKSKRPETPSIYLKTWLTDTRSL